MGKRAAIALLLWAALGAPAGAQTPSPAPSDDERARQLSNQGLDHFNHERYPQAIAGFQASYALRPLPLLIFNIAQAYRLGGDCPHALEFYRRYVRETPAAPNRMLVDGFIADMERCPVIQPSPPPAEPPPHSARRQPLHRKWWLWTSVGVVLTAGAVGLGVGLATSGPPNPSLGTVAWKP